jgi:hypothetical protein
MPTSDDDPEPGAGREDSDDREDVPLSDLREDVTGSSGAEKEEGLEKEDEKREPAADPAGDPRTPSNNGPPVTENGPPATETEPEEDADGTDSIPLSELRAEVESGEATSGTQAGEGHLFHEERVDEVEAEAVWADLLMGSGDTEGVFDPTDFEDELGVSYQVVPKTLCHRCEFFGEPPTLHCTHDGTTIHETVDMDHYRVSACPMVGEDGEDADGTGRGE